MSEADQDLAEEQAKKRLGAFCAAIARDSEEPGDVRIRARVIEETCRVMNYSWEGMMKSVQELFGTAFPK